MYFDCILDLDNNPVLNDTPDAVLEWLQGRGDNVEGIKVYIGETNRVVTARDYVARGKS